MDISLIETWDVLKSASVPDDKYLPKGLIETWDVLKFDRFSRLFSSAFGLIETWDVLKYRSFSAHSRQIPFNRNMGCIEIRHLVLVF